jgi:hypothetical protein
MRKAGSVGRLYMSMLKQCLSRKYIPSVSNDGVIFGFYTRDGRGDNKLFLGILRDVVQIFG